MRLILDGQMKNLEVLKDGVMKLGKFVDQLLKGKIAFTIKDNKIKKLNLIII